MDHLEQSKRELLTVPVQKVNGEALASGWARRGVGCVARLWMVDEGEKALVFLRQLFPPCSPGCLVTHS